MTLFIGLFVAFMPLMTCVVLLLLARQHKLRVSNTLR
jgi:hypothetical protein